MMPYELNELLHFVRLNKAVALYLIPGFAPIISTSGPPYDDLKYDLPRDCLPTALLNAVEGPVLELEDLRLLAEEIRSKCSDGKYGDGSRFVDARDVAEFRFRQDSHDFDVFLFAKGDRILIEFRQPNKWYEKGSD